MAGPTFHAAGAVTNNTSAGTSNASAIPAVTDGDLMVKYLVWTGSPGALTLPSGWTQIGSTEGPSAFFGYYMAAFQKICAGDSGSPSFQWATSRANYGYIVTVSPAAGGVPTVDTSNSGLGGNTSTANFTLASITTGQANALVMYAMTCLVASTSTAAPPAGYTEEADMAGTSTVFEGAHLTTNQAVAGATGTRTVVMGSAAIGANDCGLYFQISVYEAAPPGTTVTPTPASMTAAGSTPQLAGTVSPSSRSTTATGSTPTFVFGTSVSPAAAAMVTSRATPLILPGVSLSPTPAAMVFGSSTPSVLIALSKLPLIRVDVYVGGVKVGRGPITSVLDWEYGHSLSEIATAVLRLPADDPKTQDIATDVELRVFRGGWGFIGDYKVREYTRGRDESGVAIMEIQLDGAEVEIARENTGLGMVLDAANNQDTGQALLAGTGWSFAHESLAGSLSRPFEAMYRWAALVEAMQNFAAHIRRTDLGTGASPDRYITAGQFGADSGIILGQRGYPLVDVRAHVSRALVNRVVPIGVGEGFPMLGLDAATRGAPINGYAHLETTEALASWTAVAGCIFATGSAAFARGLTGGYLTRSGVGTNNYISNAKSLSGSTAGRVFRVDVEARSVFNTAGDTFTVGITESGGASGVATTTQTFVLGSSKQRIHFSHTIAQNDRTAVTVFIGQVGGSANGDTLEISPPIWHEVTALSPRPVIAQMLNSPRIEYYIEDEDSIDAKGVLIEYKAYKQLAPTEATVDAYYAAGDAMYDAANRYLDLHLEEMRQYAVKVLGLKHVQVGGTQLVKVGDKHRLWFHGVSNGAGWLAVNELLWNTAWRCRLTPDGAADWDLTLSSVDAHYLDALDRVTKELSDWQGSQTQMKLGNHTYEVTQSGNLGSGASPSVSSIYMSPAMDDLLAVYKVTLFVRQLSGAAKNINVLLQAATAEAQAAWPGTIALATNVDATGGLAYDITGYLRQLPTPVPWADYATGQGALTFSIALNSAGVGPWPYEMKIGIEATKLPLPPS